MKLAVTLRGETVERKQGAICQPVVFPESLLSIFTILDTTLFATREAIRHVYPQYPDLGKIDDFRYLYKPHPRSLPDARAFIHKLVPCPISSARISGNTKSPQYNHH